MISAVDVTSDNIRISQMILNYSDIQPIISRSFTHNVWLCVQNRPVASSLFQTAIKTTVNRVWCAQIQSITVQFNVFSSLLSSTMASNTWEEFFAIHLPPPDFEDNRSLLKEFCERHDSYGNKIVLVTVGHVTYTCRYHQVRRYTHIHSHPNRHILPHSIVNYLLLPLHIASHIVYQGRFSPPVKYAQTF